jgi:hypothetical protein
LLKHTDSSFLLHFLVYRWYFVGILLGGIPTNHE